MSMERRVRGAQLATAPISPRVPLLITVVGLVVVILISTAIGPADLSIALSDGASVDPMSGDVDRGPEGILGGAALPGILGVAGLAGRRQGNT